MTTDALFAQKISHIRQAGLYRQMKVCHSPQGARVKAGDREVLMLSSNSYLGLCTDDRLKEAARKAVEMYGTGAGGSRLISGTSPIHRELEAQVAFFKQTGETFKAEWALELPADATIGATLYSRVTSRTGLDRSTRGEDLGRVLFDIVPVPLAALDPRAACCPLFWWRVGLGRLGERARAPRARPAVPSPGPRAAKIHRPGASRPGLLPGASNNKPPGPRPRRGNTACGPGAGLTDPIVTDPVKMTLRATVNAKRTLLAGFTTVRNLGLFVKTSGYLLDVALSEAVEAPSSTVRTNPPPTGGGFFTAFCPMTCRFVSLHRERLLLWSP